MEALSGVMSEDEDLNYGGTSGDLGNTVAIQQKPLETKYSQVDLNNNES